MNLYTHAHMYKHTLPTLRPLFRPARVGDSEPPIRRSAPLHSSSRQRVWIRQWRLAAHPSAATRSRSGTHTRADWRDAQVLLWVLLYLHFLTSCSSNDLLTFWCEIFWTRWLVCFVEVRWGVPLNGPDFRASTCSQNQVLLPSRFTRTRKL